MLGTEPRAAGSVSLNVASVLGNPLPKLSTLLCSNKSGGCFNCAQNETSSEIGPEPHNFDRLEKRDNANNSNNSNYSSSCGSNTMAAVTAA